MSLQACYRRSAYFEYYEDELVPFYEKNIPFLFDYNEQLLHFIMKAIKMKVELKFTESYEPAYPSMEDVRNAISPKKKADPGQKPYMQVFDERMGFQQNLSIVDLLFNQGPHSMNYL